MRALDQAPSIKDLDIEKRFRDLKTFIEGCNNDDDDGDDDDNNNIGQSPGGTLSLLRYPSLSSSSPLLSTPSITPTSSLNATQKLSKTTTTTTRRKSSRSARLRINCYKAVKNNFFR